jgi:hypothetical protein
LRAIQVEIEGYTEGKGASFDNKGGGGCWEMEVIEIRRGIGGVNQPP